MKKSYSAIIQSAGEMNQFASISTDGQVLLWEKKFIDAHKKPVTDVILFVKCLVHKLPVESWVWVPLVQT
jgi:hypothetical protein